VSYTGTTGAGTFGHGLNSIPELVIVKNASNTGGWGWDIYNKDVGNNKSLHFNTAIPDTYNYWQNTTPTDEVFYVADYDGVNNLNDEFIAYCFHSVDGYSKVGSYTGNGSTDGTFVYTGFRPAYVMWKRTDGTGGWNTIDSKRDASNVSGHILFPHSSSTEADWTILDLTSNGFKMRNSYADTNGSDNDFIYLAFAETPFKYSTAK
jgi:hypothetical protein